MFRLRRLTGGAIGLATLLFGGLQTAVSGPFDFSGDLSIGSDYAFRGVSQTMSGPALTGTLVLEHESGWYGYVWASNVDFTDEGDPDDGADLEVDLELGYYRSLSDRTEISLGWVNYAFPGTKTGYNYDYDEVIGSFTIDEKHRVTVGYSDDVFASGSPGTFYSVATTLDVFSDSSISIELGHYDLERAYGTSYNYGELSLNGGLRYLDWRLSFITTSRDASDIYYESTVSDRIVLAIGVSF